MARHRTDAEILSSPSAYDSEKEIDPEVLSRCRAQLTYWDKIEHLVMDRPDIPISEIHRRAKTQLKL